MKCYFGVRDAPCIGRQIDYAQILLAAKMAVDLPGPVLVFFPKCLNHKELNKQLLIRILAHSLHLIS
jgi:hypothetical protein